MSLHIRKPKNKLFGLLVVIGLVSVLLLSESTFIGQTSALTMSPGYSSATSLTSSSLLAIDRSNFNEVQNASSVFLKFSTNQSPDVIIAVVAVTANTSLTPKVNDTAALHWRERSKATYAGHGAQLFEFDAIALNALFDDKVQVTISTNATIAEKVFGISGANTTSPFDPNPLASSSDKGTSASPSVSVTTTNPNDMILGMAYVGGSPNITIGSGFNFVGNGQTFGGQPEAFAEYEVVTSAQSGLLVSATLARSQNWIMVGDAIVSAISPSSTSVVCSPVSIAVGSPTTCTATVTGNNPTGTVSWQSGGPGTLSSSTCNLSSGSCSVTYTPTSSTTPVAITASYSGDTNNVGSSGSYSLTVTVATSSTTVSCSPSSIGVGSSATCTATVTGDSPTGTVSFKSTDSGAKFSASSCTLSSSGSCQVTYTPSATGSATITASYSGDSNNAQSSGTATTSQFAIPPTSTTTTTTTTSSSSTHNPGGSSPFSSTTLIAAIVAAVIVIGAVFASLYIRRRPAK